MSAPASGFVETARDWLMAPRTLTMQEAETIIGYLVNEIDLLRSTALDLRAELDAVRTVIPADFLDSLDGPSDPDVIERWRRAAEKWVGRPSQHQLAQEMYAQTGDDSWPGFNRRNPIETMTVDITQDHDVRAKQRRLVELDYAGNVVVEYVEKRP